MKKKERRKRKSEEKERRRREKKQWLQWRIQGRDPPPPLIFRPNLGPKGPKKDCYSFYYFESDFSFRISI